MVSDKKQISILNFNNQEISSKTLLILEDWSTKGFLKNFLAIENYQKDTRGLTCVEYINGSINAIDNIQHRLSQEEYELIRIVTITEPKDVPIDVESIEDFLNVPRNIKLKFLNIIFPRDNADSEGLLNLGEMQSDNVSDKNILIIRGVGGRELLAKSLKKRGAIVDCIEIYERKLPEYEEHEINKIWHDNNPDAVVVTSNEVLNNLIVLLNSKTKKLFSIPLVTMSERIAEYARKKGFVSTIFVVKEKSDDGILTSLLELFEG